MPYLWIKSGTHAFPNWTETEVAYHGGIFKTCFAVSLFSNPKFAHFLVFISACASLTTSHCCSLGLCIALCVVLALNSWADQREACISVTKYDLPLHFLWKLCWNYFQTIFTENKLKWKRSDGRSTKAVREHVFLLKYKSEPVIVESFVSKSSA